MYLLGDEFDGGVDYPLRRLMLDFIRGHIDAAQMQQGVMNLYEKHPLQEFYSGVELTGSDDCSRLLMELTADLPPDLLRKSRRHCAPPASSCLLYGR